MKMRVVSCLLFCFLCFSVVIHGEITMPLYKILVGTPVRQSPQILSEFLSSLERVDKDSFTFDYYFIDDNIIEESHHWLMQRDLKIAVDFIKNVHKIISRE